LVVRILDWQIVLAAQVIRQGGVIAYPTEGVWGLGCNPWDRSAVYYLLSLKSRAIEKGLIIVTGNQAQLFPLLNNIPREYRSRLKNTWPGPVTWVVEDSECWIPPWIKGRFTSAAVRVSDHPVVVALTKQLGFPLVSTSANPAQRPPARSRLQVRRYFGQQIHYLLPGSLGACMLPSEIRILQSGEILRSAGGKA